MRAARWKVFGARGARWSDENVLAPVEDCFQLHGSSGGGGRRGENATTQGVDGGVRGLARARVIRKGRGVDCVGLDRGACALAVWGVVRGESPHRAREIVRAAEMLWTIAEECASECCKSKRLIESNAS